MKKVQETTRKIPPDGGWGWAIVVASAINGLSTISIMQGFGLIFKDMFPVLGLSATDGTVIINTNFAFGMLLGLVNGPLLSKFGYRKVAIAGSFVYAIAVILTAFAKTFLILMISYGVLASIGMGLLISSFQLALNSYFLKKRGRATGLASMITGIGPIIMPQIATFLMSVYGFKGTILVFGAFTLHSLIGAMLLHPIKWHMKEVPIGATVLNEVFTSKLEKCNDALNFEDNENARDGNRGKRVRRITLASSIDHDVEIGSIYGYETPLPRQLSETLKPPSHDKNGDITSCKNTSATNLQKAKMPLDYWYSATSIDTINLGSSMNIFDERYFYQSLPQINDFNKTNNSDNCEENPLVPKTVAELKAEEANASDKKGRKRSIIMRFLKRVAKFYDLALLRDPIYVNIMLGMSIATFAEFNFSFLTPFILSDMGLLTGEIASAMSLIATVDLVLRGLAPFIGEWLNQPPRRMYLLSLLLLIVSRSSLLFVRSFTSVMIVAIGLGIAKGIRSVYMTLVVPSHVPIQRLPYASGIQMVVNGVILISTGPVLGAIRDYTGDYFICLIVINCVTLVTVIMWITEILIVYRINSRQRRKQQKEVYSYEKS